MAGLKIGSGLAEASLLRGSGSTVLSVASAGLRNLLASRFAKPASDSARPPTDRICSLSPGALASAIRDSAFGQPAFYCDRTPATGERIGGGGRTVGGPLRLSKTRFPTEPSRPVKTLGRLLLTY